MNLLENLKKEVTELKSTNKLQIARYIYRKTGKLFEYDPNWFFKKEEREDLKSKQIDINNVTDYNITSFSWAKMYSELLREFGIDSRVKYTQKSFQDEKTGAYFINTVYANVEVLIDGEVYIADLNINDMAAIKFGLNTHYNCEPLKESNRAKKYPTEEEAKINRIKEMLNIIKDKEHLSNQEYIFQVYRAIQNNINFTKPNVGFAVGKAYIDKLLEFLTSSNYKSYNVSFYDNEKQKYMSVYIVPLNGENHFFSYEKQVSGLYNFDEIPKERIDFYFQNYKYKLSETLKQKVNANKENTTNNVVQTRVK